MKITLFDKIRSGLHPLSRIYFFFINLFNPPYNKERKVIPRFVWKDRDTVIRDFLFVIFTEYLEKEDPLWTLMDDMERRQDFLAINRWIKQERPFLIKKIEQCDDHTLGELLDTLDQNDNKYEELIFKYRQTLWT